MCSPAPSWSSSAVPSTSKYLYGSSLSQTVMDNRGSFTRLRPLAREGFVLKTTRSPSVSTHTTLVCGRPSSPTVPTTPKCLPAFRSASCLSESAGITEPPFLGSGEPGLLLKGVRRLDVGHLRAV